MAGTGDADEFAAAGAGDTDEVAVTSDRAEETETPVETEL